MIVIGIPTYNEESNISSLTKKIDDSAEKLGIAIVIVNADSNSTDDTVTRFMNTSTKNKKVSIENKKKGKGFNVHSILRFVDENQFIDGCVLIDGDVTSFDASWLTEQIKMINDGYDYVVPSYARNYQEGNTTNHFVYPLLGMRFDGKVPRQPIAGDFGMSRSFAKHILKQRWHAYSHGYGIDIFLTLHALHGGYKVGEIRLGKKIHKPSFEKMIPMFNEVASSYYETIRQMTVEQGLPRDVRLTRTDPPSLLQAQPILKSDILARKNEAVQLCANTRSFIPTLKINSLSHVNTEPWIDILINHEKMVGKTASHEIAESILPWYLIRVVTYLEDNNDAQSATDEIQDQFDQAVQQFREVNYDRFNEKTPEGESLDSTPFGGK